MDYNQLADAADRAAVQAQSWVEIRDAFRALGSIDGATKEANSKRDAAVKSAETAKAELASLVKQGDDAFIRRQDLIADAELKVAAIKAEADASAAQTLVDTDEIAAERIAMAKRDAAALIAKTNADLQSKFDRSGVFDIDIKTKADELKAIEAKTESAQKDLDAVNAMIAKLAGR